MRLTVLAVGSRGDVEPYVGLSLGLSAAGHDVRLATHARFRTLVEQRALGFAELGGDPRAVVESEAGQAWLEAGSDPVALWRRFRPLVEESWASAARSSLEACVGAEAVIYSALGFAGHHAADALGVPSVAAYLQPITPTRAFPAALAPTRRRLPGALNLLSHVALAQAFWQLYRSRVNAWRRDALGLEPVPFLGPYGRLRRERHPVLYGFSPTVVPKPADWDDWVHVTGYWFTPPPAGWGPPAALLDFLDAGPAPVAIGFGSMRPRRPEELAGTVLAAVRRTRLRAVVQAGWAELGGAGAPDDQIFEVGELPHSWLFERAAALVHHGGAGTTAAGLRAGRPAVVVPFFADQFFWADRVARVGAGPRPVRGSELTPATLARAMRRATDDAALRARAAAVGARVRGEDGVSRAVALFERHAAAGPAEP